MKKSSKRVSSKLTQAQLGWIRQNLEKHFPAGFIARSEMKRALGGMRAGHTFANDDSKGTGYRHILKTPGNKSAGYFIDEIIEDIALNWTVETQEESEEEDPD